MKKAIIFGITGQDGSYLADLLLSKEYEIVGIIRRSSVNNTYRIKHLLDDPRLALIEGDVTDYVSISSAINQHRPDEVYNLAAQSHVKTSFDQPIYTWQANAEGPLNILEAIRNCSPKTKFYQASTSEMFGKNYSIEADRKFQSENTPFLPQSPYAIAKLSAHHTVRIYREAYDVFACSGILFNHESERRGELFVTRKITKWIADFFHWCKNIHVKPSEINIADLIFTEEDIRVPRDRFIDAIAPIILPKLRLGNLDAKRDWGHAKDYVRGMWLMLQQDKSDDYVLATGHSYSVREFLDRAFSHIGVSDWSKLVYIDPAFYRPAEVDYLCGVADKAKAAMGWETEIGFETLVEGMVDHDLGLEAKSLDWQDV